MRETAGPGPALPHPIVTPSEQGGDPPCWAGLTTDHRDRPDITSRTEINDIVLVFYREVMFDDLLQPIFDEVAEVDWPEHILHLIDYWCWILLGTQGFGGSVTRTHRHLHGLQPIEAEHCDRWMALWRASVDQRCAGPVADKAVAHAEALMAGMARHVFGITWSPTRPG